MGQNKFSLMGTLRIEPGTTPHLMKLHGYEVPYVAVTIESGPEYAGELHTIFLTGTAAEIAYEWFKRKPDGFTALVEGSLKTFGGQTRPVAVYLSVYEKPEDELVPPAARPEMLASQIVKNMSKEQVRTLLERIRKELAQRP